MQERANNDFIEKLDYSNRIPRFGKNDYARESVDTRRKWLENKLNISLESIGDFTQDTQKIKGNIEHLIGVAQVPIGIAGPIKVNGEYAKGDFYVPLATTEGVLVKTYHAGMALLNKVGGVNVKILKDAVHISPVFLTSNLSEAQELSDWIDDQFDLIRKCAESTTNYGKLLQIDNVIIGGYLVSKLSFFTADAQGLNMINKAVKEVCELIKEKYKIEYLLRSDLSAIKKVSTMNNSMGQGKSVFAEAIVSKNILKLLDTTPEKVVRYHQIWSYVKNISGIIGQNIHVANILAATFIACGQDVADIAMSHVATLSYRLNENKELYMSLYVANLMVGTVGGGTGLATQRKCLEIMGCYGKDRVKKFGEIICAAALAGEIACTAALDNGTYVEAHEKYGRNKSKI